MSRALVVLVVGLAAPLAAVAQQLGVPLSSLPGVEAGMPAVTGGSSGGIEGIAVPGGRLDRLLMAPTGTSQTAVSVGQQIERSFFGEGRSAPGAAPFGMNGGAASALTGDDIRARGGRGATVAPQGVGVQLPTAQQLMPQHLVPGYQTLRSNASASPTGVGNVFTGSGQPRAGESP
jgi:hypothetical protein